MFDPEVLQTKTLFSCLLGDLRAVTKVLTASCMHWYNSICNLTYGRHSIQWRSENLNRPLAFRNAAESKYNFTSPYHTPLPNVKPDPAAQTPR